MLRHKKGTERYFTDIMVAPSSSGAGHAQRSRDICIELRYAFVDYSLANVSCSCAMPFNLQTSTIADSQGVTLEEVTSTGAPEDIPEACRVIPDRNLGHHMDFLNLVDLTDDQLLALRAARLIDDATAFRAMDDRDHTKDMGRAPYV